MAILPGDAARWMWVQLWLDLPGQGLAEIPVRPGPWISAPEHPVEWGDPATRPVAAEDLTWEWGSDHPWTAPSAATMTMTLLCPPGAPLPQWDAYLVTRVGVPVPAPQGVWAEWHWWVTGWRRRQLGDGRSLVRVAATDIIGRLAAIRLSDEPWPAEVISDRLRRIARAAGIPDLIDQAGLPPWPEHLLGPRDVDSLPALDAVMRAIPAGWRLIPRGGRVGISRAAGRHLRWPATSIERVAIRPAPGATVTDLPGDAVEQPADDHLDRSSLLTSVAISGVQYDPGAADPWPGRGRSYVITGPQHREGQTSRLRWETDLAVTPDLLGLDQARAWADSLVARSVPEPTAGSRRVILGRLPRETITAMLAEPAQPWHLITIDGQAYALTAGTARYEGHHLTLEATLAPATIYGARSLTWADIPPRPSPRSPIMWDMMGPATWAETTGITTWEDPA